MHNGQTVPENILIMDVEKHKYLHYIFGNLDFYDIILLLIRTSRIKGYEKINHKIEQFYKHL